MNYIINYSELLRGSAAELGVQPQVSPTRNTVSPIEPVVNDDMKVLGLIKICFFKNYKGIKATDVWKM